MITLEVKVEGTRTREKANSSITYEVVSIDWSEFKIVPTKSANRHLITNNKQAFQILKSGARQKYLEENGYEQAQTEKRP